MSLNCILWLTHKKRVFFCLFLFLFFVVVVVVVLLVECYYPLLVISLFFYDFFFNQWNIFAVTRFLVTPLLVTALLCLVTPHKRFHLISTKLFYPLARGNRWQILLIQRSLIFSLIFRRLPTQKLRTICAAVKFVSR